MDELLRLSDKNGLALLEDAAQATARYKGKRAGSMGHASGLAFILQKPWSMGRWRAMVTSDTSLYEKSEKIRNYGQEKKYFPVRSVGTADWIRFSNRFGGKTIVGSMEQAPPQHCLKIL